MGGEGGHEVGVLAQLAGRRGEGLGVDPPTEAGLVDVGHTPFAHAG